MSDLAKKEVTKKEDIATKDIATKDISTEDITTNDVVTKIEITSPIFLGFTFGIGLALAITLFGVLYAGLLYYL